MTHTKPPASSDTPSMRLDKWLWAARFFKTRSLATEAIHKGHVSVNGSSAKPAREVRAGDSVALRQGNIPKTVQVLGISATRGPAPVAQLLYEETADSIAAREQAAQARRLAPEPADALRDGRPTKRDRRNIDQLRGGWGSRWSASLDDDASGKS